MQINADKDKIQKLKAKDRNKAINKRTVGMNKKGQRDRRLNI